MKEVIKDVMAILGLMVLAAFIVNMIIVLLAVILPDVIGRVPLKELISAIGIVTCLFIVAFWIKWSFNRLIGE